MPRSAASAREGGSRAPGCSCPSRTASRSAASSPVRTRDAGRSRCRSRPNFTARERAALAFTEAVTLLAQTHIPDAAYQEVAAEFSADEVGALVSLIVTINAWNAIGVATRAWEPGSYQP